ncbi:MAG: hypothetical protein QW331_02205 [Candidatus Woesearchaeota archaeon]
MITGLELLLGANLATAPVWNGIGWSDTEIGRHETFAVSLPVGTHLPLSIDDDGPPSPPPARFAYEANFNRLRVIRSRIDRHDSDPLVDNTTIANHFRLMRYEDARLSLSRAHTNVADLSSSLDDFVFRRSLKQTSRNVVLFGFDDPSYPEHVETRFLASMMAASENYFAKENLSLSLNFYFLLLDHNLDRNYQSRHYWANELVRNLRINPRKPSIVLYIADEPRREFTLESNDWNREYERLNQAIKNEFFPFGH